MSKELMVNCCGCKKSFSYYESEYRPFCSERCKMIDLGHWFQEEYGIASEKPLTYEEVVEIEHAMAQKELH